MRFDHAALAQDEGPLQDIFEFPDISGIVVGHQAGKRLVADAGYVLLLDGVQVMDEVCDQKRQVFQPLPQGRQCDADDIDPVVEVFAKPAFADQTFQ